MRALTLTLAALLGLTAMGAALADPPSWAPAHGYRDKHGHDDDDGHKGRSKRRGRDDRAVYYVGYSGREYDRDFEIARGRCNREQVGAVLGGIAGGVIGNRVADRDDRVVATILGAAIGALVGSQVGRSLDDRDRACIGQALELGRTGQSIAWQNESNGRRYELVPGDGTQDPARTCRAFALRSIDDGQSTLRRGRACQTRPGVWEIG